MGLFGILGSNKSKEPSFNPYDAVFMLYQVGKPWNQPYVPSVLKNYYSSEHNFSNTTYQRIISNGWIQPSSKISALGSLKLTELKDIAAQYDIPVKGKKDDIVHLLSENLTEELLAPISIPIVAELSTKGKELLSQYPYLEFMKTHRQSICCDLFVFHENWIATVSQFPSYSFKDLLLESLDSECFNFSDISRIDRYDYDSEREYEKALREYERDWEKRAKEDYRDAVKYIKEYFKQNTAKNKNSSAVESKPKRARKTKSASIFEKSVFACLSDFIESSDLSSSEDSNCITVFYKKGNARPICKLVNNDSEKLLFISNDHSDFDEYKISSIDDLSEHQHLLIESLVRYL